MRVKYILISLLVLFSSAGMIHGESDSAGGTRVDAAGTRQPNDDGSLSDSGHPNTTEESAITESEEVVVPAKIRKTRRKHGFTNIQRREVNPCQMQLLLDAGTNLTGHFAPSAGLHLGYQVSKVVYVGWSFQTYYDSGEFGPFGGDNFPNDNNRYDEEYRERVLLGQKGARRVETDSHSKHLLEMRLFPFDFGLYFSPGIMRLGAEKRSYEFGKRKREVGDNEYTDTGLEATMEYGEWSGPTAGIGFNHIFENGFSLGVGASIGLTVQKPEVTVASTGSVTAADLEIWKEEIELNEGRIPGQFSFAIGFAF